MTEEKPQPASGAETTWASAMPAEDEEQRAKLAEAAADFRIEMEQIAAQICELIQSQPPQELLGYST